MRKSTRLPAVNSEIQFSGASIRCMSAMPLAAPRANVIIPSVMMNGASFSRVTRKPFVAPARHPSATPPARATAGTQTASIPPRVAPASAGDNSRTIQADPTAVRAMMLPADRSMPPEMMISVMPMAPIATVTVCVKIKHWFCGDQ